MAFGPRLKFANFSKLAFRVAIRMTQVNAFDSQFNDFLSNPEIRYLSKLFAKESFNLKIAGGAVRDLLSGLIPNDVDFATDARPDQSFEILSNQPGIRVITTESGQKHGTVSALINQKLFEITTLRVDKKTDGRHAEVEFIGDWKLDATRRDFTINAMFLDVDGKLTDYYNGLEDLKNGKIRFVGDASSRIKEDYLRILRYFRFFARFGKYEHEAKTIDCIKANLDGLNNISGERIWSEFKKILPLPNANLVIPVMFDEVKIGPHIGFDTDHLSISHFNEVCSNLNSSLTSFEPITLFTSLISNEDSLYNLVRRLKLSNLEREISLYIITNRDKKLNALRHYQKQLCLTPKSYQTNMRKYISEYLKYQNLHELFREFDVWTIPLFPVRGNIIAGKIKKPKLIGQVKNELLTIWADSGFEMTTDELLQELNKLVEMFNKEVNVN